MDIPRPPRSRLGRILWLVGAAIALAALTVGLSRLKPAAPEPAIHLETWKEYLVFHAFEHHAAYLPKAFVEGSFAFHGEALSSTPTLQYTR